MTNNFFSRSQLDRYALDDDTRFWVELYETIELNPIREFKNIIIEIPYENKVSLDLDTRISAIIELLGSKKSNIFYVMGMAERLRDKCIKENRYDLIETFSSIKRNTLDYVIKQAQEAQAKEKAMKAENSKIPPDVSHISYG